MFKKIDLFFFHLTKNNWGFPWHIILATILTKAIIIFFEWLLAHLGVTLIDQSLKIRMYAWVIVNIVGWVNEIIESKTGNNPKKDLIQDVIGNNIGWVIGIF